MPSLALLRLALRLLGALAIFATFVAQPALACYCVEFTSCKSVEVKAPTTGEGEAPQPNSYVVEVTWEKYPGAPSNCTYSVEGKPAAGSSGWVEQSTCTITSTTAECVVTATSGSGQPVGTTWTFHVSGSDGHYCETQIFLPGSLDAPSNPEGSRGDEGMATIRWAAPEGRQIATGSAAIQRYAVYRHTDRDSSRKAVGETTTTQFVDQGLSASETYHYEIYAADQYGLGNAATVDLPGTGGGVTGGCSSAGAGAAPLALIAFGALWRRRRRRA